MAPFTVRPLEPADVDPAYVLTQLVPAGPTLDDWRARAGRVLDDPGGEAVILVAVQPGRSLSGMACLTPAPAGDGAPVLGIERLVAFDLVDPERVAHALLGAAFRLAGGRGGLRLASGEPLADPAAAARVLSAATTTLHRVI